LVSVLLDNACRYAGAGGRVDLGVALRGGRVTLTVEDSGPGIPEDQRELVFDRFHRADDRPGGTGLGLAIADVVVRNSGGTWSVGASPSGGARMEVSWRQAPVAPSRAVPTPGPVGSPSG
jgi:signal transduction histidine kinase